MLLKEKLAELRLHILCPLVQVLRLRLLVNVLIFLLLVVNLEQAHELPALLSVLLIEHRRGLGEALLFGLRADCPRDRLVIFVLLDEAVPEHFLLRRPQFRALLKALPWISDRLHVLHSLHLLWQGL